MSNEQNRKETLGKEIKLLVANRLDAVPTGVTFDVTKDMIVTALAKLFSANNVNLRDLGAHIGVRLDRASFNGKNVNPLDISIYIKKRHNKSQNRNFLPFALRCLDGVDQGYEEINLMGNEDFLKVLNTLAATNKHGEAKIMNAYDPSNGKPIKGYRKVQLDFDRTLAYLFCADEVRDGRILTFDFLGYRGKKPNQFTVHLLKEINRNTFKHSKKDPLAAIL